MPKIVKSCLKLRHCWCFFSDMVYNIIYMHFLHVCVCVYMQLLVADVDESNNAAAERECRSYTCAGFKD